MNRRSLFPAILISLTLGLLPSTLALAGAPPLPASFYGTAQLDGTPVPVGTTVSAWIDGVQYAETATFVAAGQSAYLLHVPGDDPDTPAIEGGTPGDTVVFQVGGHQAIQTAPWQSGEHSGLNLTAYTTPLVAAFSATPASPFIGDVVQFTDQSVAVGTIIGWDWDFADGGTSTLQHPAHAYTAAGTFTVTLTVADDGGLTDSASQPITVRALPTAAFTFSPETPRAGQAIQFTDQSTDADGAIVAWDWDFGDGTTSTLQHPTHTYSTEGDYFVTLTVTDNDGNTNSFSRQLRVLGPVMADFTFTPDPAIANQPVQFTDASTSTVRAIAAWLWDFDDGTTSTGQNPATLTAAWSASSSSA